MSIKSKQLPTKYLEIINSEIEIFSKGTSITVENDIPDTKHIPLLNKQHWIRIPEVICVFVDMKNSTKLSATNYDKTTAGAYQLFTSTAVNIFHNFNSPYIDVKGDGVFALFNSRQVYRALASAVTFKTFAAIEFVPRIRKKTGVDVGCHIGIDQRTVLVRKIGLKFINDRSDRQNEVWAGKPVNMASKLASLGEDGELHVSERYFEKLKDKRATNSCGCPSGAAANLWSTVDVKTNPWFDFATAYKLTSNWCENHGSEYLEHLISLEKD